MWGYLGTDQIGTIRVGSIDQPTSLYLTGNFENFNDGGWNGDLPGFFAGNVAPAWPFSDIGSYYTTNKPVVLFCVEVNSARHAFLNGGRSSRTSFQSTGAEISS